MTSSCFFDNGPRKNDSFSGSFEEILERFTYLGSTLVDSPKQLPLPLPDSDPPSPLRAQPSTVRPPAREARHPAGFVVGLSNPMAHTSFDNRGRSPQPNLQRIPHLGPFFNPRDSIVTPTTQRSPATLGVGRPLVHGDLPSSVASGSSPVHDFQQYSSTCGPPRYNDPHMFVGQREPFHSAMGMPHGQMQLAPVSVVQNSSSIPSDSQLQLPSTRHPTGTSSFPIQSASPKEMVLPSGQLGAPTSRYLSKISAERLPHKFSLQSDSDIFVAGPIRLA
ncbi:hypothetical protein HD554DRAFT_2167516 [Boletus coccyginus]|nr:hypothetical protein HD554DRAFT_2167516 [Boletus coccyginus]